MKLRIYVNDLQQDSGDTTLLTTVNFNLNCKYKVLMMTHVTSHAFR